MDLYEGQVIYTTEWFRTDILITRTFEEELCFWCGKLLLVPGLCGRYTVKDLDEPLQNIVLCKDCCISLEII